MRQLRGLVLTVLVSIGLILGPGLRDAEAWCWWNCNYAKTKYPIVLAHGAAGFDELFGVYEYFYGIPDYLEDKGATVFTTEVSQLNSTEVRGEQLIDQIEVITAITGKPKVNLIGHSHGGLDVRYVAAVRPDLVASVTSVGSPHKGADLADYLEENFEDGSFTQGVIAFFAESLATVIGLVSGTTNPQDGLGALASLTTAGTAAFNATYPAGVPASSCGEGASVVNGIRYYSWSGTGVLTNALDVSAFRLDDGRRVSVLDGWQGPAEQQAFLAQVQEGACALFRGVLGPDYNAAHRNHFHLDMGPYGLCR